MSRTSIVGLALASLALIAAGGCLGNDPLVSGLAKVAGGRILSLESAELQAITLWAEEQAGTEQVPLTDEQAAAVLQFLADNQINTLTQAQYLADNPDQVIISDEVREMISEEEARQFLERLGYAAA